MNYKEQLKELLKKFNQLKESIKVQINEIGESEKYSDDYKRELINKVKQESKVNQEELSSEALGIIRTAKSELLKGKGTVDKDQSFDIKFSNVLKVLERVGADMTVEELQELIIPFKDDYYTMKILRRIFVKGEFKGINEIFGIDTIDHNVKTLDELERNIAYTLNGDITQSNTMKIIIAIDMLGV